MEGSGVVGAPLRAPAPTLSVLCKVLNVIINKMCLTPGNLGQTNKFHRLCLLLCIAYPFSMLRAVEIIFLVIFRFLTYIEVLATLFIIFTFSCVEVSLELKEELKPIVIYLCVPSPGTGLASVLHKY